MLLDLIKSQISNQLNEKIASKLGVDEEVIGSVIDKGLPLIMGQLNKNSETEQGAESLNKALEKHDGSLLDNLADIVENNAAQDDGKKILNHVFSDQIENVIGSVGKDGNINSDQTKQILSMLAPVVMSFIGKQKNSENLDTSSLQNLLSNEMNAGEIMNNPMVKQFLDKDGDGSIVDDLVGMIS